MAKIDTPSRLAAAAAVAPHIYTHARARKKPCVSARKKEGKAGETTKSSLGAKGEGESSGKRNARVHTGAIYLCIPPRSCERAATAAAAALVRSLSLARSALSFHLVTFLRVRVELPTKRSLSLSLLLARAPSAAFEGDPSLRVLMILILEQRSGGGGVAVPIDASGEMPRVGEMKFWVVNAFAKCQASSRDYEIERELWRAAGRS